MLDTVSTGSGSDRVVYATFVSETNPVATAPGTDLIQVTASYQTI